ncbi:hypothetical protein [Parageobacillus thermoglucosidasius]|uniref:hypothetical protein n=1 Tax=Parageobacillus thermoglucosidasius TaxID=1426 RepID=UPI000E141AF1|nr:hypothetical protein [Parageobacillus thermoglucosidasius]RDE27450.1 hypothetical protein DV714_10635 [Parageobacillus thermoglucosidasius]
MEIETLSLLGVENGIDEAALLLCFRRVQGDIQKESCCMVEYGMALFFLFAAFAADMAGVCPGAMRPDWLLSVW